MARHTPLTDKLYEAKGAIQYVLDRTPVGLGLGSGAGSDLEHALELVGEAADYFEAREDPDSPPAVEAAYTET